MSNFSRRHLLSVATAAGTGMAFLGQSDSQTSQASPAATPAAEESATPGTATMYSLQADAPAWAFTLHSLRDPYTSKLTFPSEIPAGSRVVHAEVVIINDSEQPLNFQTSNVRLLDSEGIEYGGGNAQGSEPRLVSQVLPGGQQSRGSVWFIVPVDAMLMEIKFYGPSPQFRVRLEANQ